MYRELYPNRLVLPRGNCEQVNVATRAFRSVPGIHDLEPCGIVDRDFRTDDELTAYEANGVHPLKVAEVENLLCVEEIIRLITASMNKNPDELLQKVHATVFKVFRGMLPHHATQRTIHRIQSTTNNIGKVPGDADAAVIKATFDSTMSSIDVQAIYNDNHQTLSDILASNKPQCLACPESKGPVKGDRAAFSLHRPWVEDFVLALLRSDKADDYRNAGIAPYVPGLPPNALATPGT